MTDEEVYTSEPVESAPDPEPEQAPVEGISVGATYGEDRMVVQP